MDRVVNWEMDRVVNWEMDRVVNWEMDQDRVVNWEMDRIPNKWLNSLAASKDRCRTHRQTSLRHICQSRSLQCLGYIISS